MVYEEVIAWLFGQLPMYQKVGGKAYKADLINTIKLSTHLGNPENKFKSVHVAGTNGKGSTSHMLASVLQEVGYKVGLYTSPHLKDFRERIKINGQMIPKSNVMSFVTENKAFFEKESFSFFEMTVGMAFDFFNKQKVDIAVIEVGLGGRLDSTNIITPEVSVITNIGMDHTQFLGNTLEKIAFEKGGVIKRNTPCVIGSFLEETKPIFEELAAKNNSELIFASNKENKNFKTDLLGAYQKENSNTAYYTLLELNKRGWQITDSSIEKGFSKVVENTGLQGRWQQLGTKPTIICDTAHNKEGLIYVIPQLLKQPYTKLHIVLGFVNDKNLDEILQLFPQEALYYFTKPNNRRALGEKDLMKKAEIFKLKGSTFTSVEKAFINAKEEASVDDLIFVGGSTFVVAEIL